MSSARGRHALRFGMLSDGRKHATPAAVARTRVVFDLQGRLSLGVAGLSFGMSDETTIQVNFGRPMPLFPLDQVALLPQQVRPLHIFEPRYRQMVEHALDGAGQIALAVFERRPRNQAEYLGNPPIRPAVCVGQIVQHEKLSDGRYNVLVQGICRARVLHEMPHEGERLYRAAMLEPIGPEGVDEGLLVGVRGRLEQCLSEGEISQMRRAREIVEFIRNERIPTSALMEVISFTMISDPAVQYRLLAEGDPLARWEIISQELDGLQRLIRMASKQHPEEWPKGCSWN